jgi:hypothetical protein
MNRLQYGRSLEQEQEESRLEQDVIEQLVTQLEPLVERMDAYLDKRLVRTAIETIAAMIILNNPRQGLHLSKLGAYVKNGAQAPAGTKKIERLLHSAKWEAQVTSGWLWERASKVVKDLNNQGKRALCVWDGSRLEKPESEQTEGMCAVLSSKGKRLRKPRKGVWNPPGGKPITVLGIEWTGILVLGMQGVPQVATMEFWSRKGEHATTQREVEKRLLWETVQQLGRNVLHIFDRGYAGKGWLELLSMLKVPFVIRWKGGHHFTDVKGEEKALWKIARGKRSWGYRDVEDNSKEGWSRRSVVAMPVRHAGYAGPLWLVVGRGKKDPWYLITNQPVETEEQAWEMVMSYARRWKIEETFRFEKCEMGIESVCLKSWEAREKLLSLLTVAYSFLLSFCYPANEVVKTRLLRLHCHRTGKRYQEVKIPLYRIRWALSDFWHERKPIPLFAFFLPTLYHPNFCSSNLG